MNIVTIDKDPELLQTLVRTFAPLIGDEEISTEFSGALRTSWEGFRLEGQHYLNLLPDADGPELRQVEDHYTQKVRYLTAERKWLAASRHAFSLKVKTDRDYQKKLTSLNDIREERSRQVLRIALPDVRDMPIGLGKRHRKYNEAIHEKFLRSSIEASRTVLGAVGHIIDSYRRRRIYRRLYRVGIEKFWGFLVLTLLFEQILQKWLEEHIPAFLLSSLPYPRLWHGLFLLVFLFILYEVKEKFINPRIHKYSLHVHKKHLSKDILAAAEAQIRLEAISLLEQSLHKAAEASVKTKESSEAER